MLFWCKFEQKRPLFQPPNKSRRRPRLRFLDRSTRALEAASFPHAAAATTGATEAAATDATGATARRRPNESNVRALLLPEEEEDDDDDEGDDGEEGDEDERATLGCSANINGLDVSRATFSSRFCSAEQTSG